MPNVEFQCPICSGMFGVEVSASSLEVVCPHCSNVVGVPAMSGTAGPPPGSLPPPPPPPPSENPQMPPGSPLPTVPMTGNPMLPPGASLPATTFSADLPAEQSVGDVSTTKVDVDTTEANQIAERLLPPGAAGPMTCQQPLPTAPMEEPSIHLAEGDILIPTEEGMMVALHEPVKRVSHHGEVIELRRLTPEEKWRRRRKMTLCMISIGAATLLATIYYLLTK